MAQSNTKSSSTSLAIKKLEQRIEKLVMHCEHMHAELDQYQTKEAMWEIEKAQLTEKNQLARTRVEAMIKRLKSLELQA